MRLLVNFFYAQPVGHAVEALYHCGGYHAADPSLEIHLALNAATATELAALCPFVTETYAIRHPFLEPCADSDARVAGLPREWEWIADDGRRHQPFQLDLFPGMRDYYAATDRRLAASMRRGPISYPPPPYARHTPLRLRPPPSSGPGDGGIAVMPAGSGDRSLYPSRASWDLVLDALHEAFPDRPLVLVGRRARDERTSTSMRGEELEALLAHPSRPADLLDAPLLEQLAAVQRCGVFVAPHTGFGMAALAVGTPWLAISGGRWFEFFFNHVPFRSIVPDTSRFPAYTTFEAPPEVEDDGPRTASMTRARIAGDLPRIVAAARELLGGELDYERALREYFADLAAAFGGDTSAIWSLDAVHADYLPQ
jgi:hypothetical protein